MSRLSPTTSVAGSLLDRLRNDEASRGKVSAAQSLRDLKQSVLRDLQNLLNTRWRCKSWPPSLAELDRSLVNYGIPDFGGVNLGTQQAREEFRKILEKTIRNFETRFGNVSVKEAPPEPGDSQRTLRYRVDATLLVEPVEPIRFETALEPATAALRVSRVER